MIEAKYTNSFLAIISLIDISTRIRHDETTDGAKPITVCGARCKDVFAFGKIVFSRLICITSNIAARRQHRSILHYSIEAFLSDTLQSRAVK